MQLKETIIIHIVRTFFSLFRLDNILGHEKTNITCSLSPVDKSFPDLPIGKHRRCLDIVPVLTSKRINTEIIVLHEKICTHTTYSAMKTFFFL